MSDSASGSGDARLPMPRRSRASVVVPIAVVCLTIGAVAWSAWPVIRPARSIVATQAAFDLTSGSAPIQTQGDALERGGTTVQAAGWIEPEPYAIACTALADGVVESIEVLEGDPIEQGQVVARLVSADAEIRLRRAQALLKEAESALMHAEAEHDAAIASWEDPIELDRALESSRAMLAESQAELAQLPMRVNAGKANLARLQAERDWITESAEGGAATELELTIAQRLFEAQQAEVDALNATGPVLEARIRRMKAEIHAAERYLALRIEDRRRVDASEAALSTARARVSFAQAERDEAALELERMTIRSPITGVVLRRLRAPGDKVMLGMDDPHSAHIVHLYDPLRLQVRVDVPLADVSEVYVGQSCQIVVESLPGTTLRGEVLRVLYEADVQKNTLELQVRVIDPPDLVRPEMLTRVTFQPGGGDTGAAEARERSSGGRVLVPAETLWARGGQNHVWAVTHRHADRGRLRAVAIERLSERDGWVSVAGELQAGALLAIAEEGLREGDRVIVGSIRDEGRP